jgi:DNA-binding MarR family transcriptional regulator
MTAPTRPRSVDPAVDERGAAITAARDAMAELLVAERRLRGRDQQRRDKMTYAQSRALIALSESGGADVSAGQLAKAADLHPATVTAMLDLLEDQGLVVRRRSSTDRRCVLVALTTEGQALLESKRAEWHSRWSETLEDVDAVDIQTAARVMSRLAGIFSGL